MVDFSTRPAARRAAAYGKSPRPPDHTGFRRHRRVAGRYGQRARVRASARSRLEGHGDCRRDRPGFEAWRRARAHPRGRGGSHGHGVSAGSEPRREPRCALIGMSALLPIIMMPSHGQAGRRVDLVPRLMFMQQSQDLRGTAQLAGGRQQIPKPVVYERRAGARSAFATGAGAHRPPAASSDETELEPVTRYAVGERPSAAARRIMKARFARTLAAS